MMAGQAAILRPLEGADDWWVTCTSGTFYPTGHGPIPAGQERGRSELAASGFGRLQGDQVESGNSLKVA